MIVTYRYRLLPSRRQHRALEAILESQRQLYNAALEERIGAHRRGVNRSYADQTKALTEWRRSDEDARALPVSLQRGTLRRLDGAYKGFFRRIKAGLAPGFPRFRGRGRFDSFAFSEFFGITLREAKLRFKGMPGPLRVHMHRPLPTNAVIKGCVLRTAHSSWTVSLSVERPELATRAGLRSVGVDLGLSTFAALSDGGFIPALRAARRAERRIRIAQRALARKRVGSRSRRRAREWLARAHARVARERLDFLHQASARLVRDYDVIAVETLRIHALARSGLARAVRDAAWGKFISMIRYKAACAGVRVIEVDCDNTTRDCSRCGVPVTKTLDDRQHCCPGCGLIIDRDLNAARNILSRAGVGPGLPNVAGCGLRAGENLSGVVS